MTPEEIKEAGDDARWLYGVATGQMTTGERKIDILRMARALLALEAHVEGLREDQATVVSKLLSGELKFAAEATDG